MSGTIDDAPQAEIEISAVGKRKTSRRGKIIIVSIIVISSIVLISMIAYMSVVSSCGCIPGDGVPPIVATRSSNATAWTWTVMVIGGGTPILKSDVYVQLQVNNTGTFVIQTVSLTAANDTHGFAYDPANGGTTISIGDVFALDKSYTHNTVLFLVPASGIGQYVSWVV